MTALPLAAVLLSSLAFGQQAGDEKKDLGTIEGRTTNAVTGDPIRKVKITFSPGMGPEANSYSATSDAEGRFVLKDLAPGTYRLWAEKAGYLGEPGGGPSVTVAKGQQVKDVEYKLTPQAVIMGKVLDDEGEPVRQAYVHSMLQPGSGSRRWGGGMSGGEMTNDLGEFRIAGLAPGRYILSTNPAGAFQSRPEAKKDEPQEAFVPTYYPGSIDAAGASPITVAAGQEVTGANIVLQKARVYRIEGKIASPTADMYVSVSPRERGSQGFMMGGGLGRVKPDGNFTVFDVQPGAYYLSVHSRGTGFPQMVARVPVDVTDSNVTGVLVQPLEPIQISGAVRVEGQEKPGAVGSRVWLRPLDESPMPMRPIAVEANGTFKIQGLMPAKYYLQLMPVPEKMYVKSVRLKNQDAIESGLDLSQAQGTVPVEVLLGTKPATVEASVKVDSKPVKSANVLLIPDPYHTAARDRLRNGATDQNGTVSLTSVAPGDYRAVAMEDTPDLFFGLDADTLKSLAAKGVKVTVAEGETAKVDLAPMKPDDE